MNDGSAEKIDAWDGAGRRLHLQEVGTRDGFQMEPVFIPTADKIRLVDLLSACGFELRRAPALQFTTIQLRGFGRRSEMEDELRRNINASTTSHVVESAAEAQVVLETQVDALEKVVVASTAAGQVREVTLRNRFTFRVRTPSGTELIPSTEILLTRDMSYNETFALAKEQEETVLYRAMQSDIVAQVMRRLAAIRPPA